MKFSLSRALLTCGLLAFLGGCNGMGGSWFGHAPSVAQNHQPAQTDEAPPPKAAPAEPVQALVLPGSQARTANTPVAGARGAPPVAGAVKVAILLPLSGKNAAIGQAMLNAAQMAVFDMSGGTFELIPRDTGATEASAGAAARDAIASGAQLLIGPLFGTQVSAVRAAAEPNGISILTLSTDTSLAAPGVFVMGFAPGPQVDRVVNFATTQGARRFAALVPDNAYGTLVSQAFQSAVARAGGTVAYVQTFDSAQHNVAAAAVTLAPYRDRIDALFLPEGGSELETIATQLAGAGFDSHRIHMLGTGLWDEPGLSDRIPFLSGGWYAASDPSARKNFVASYVRSYTQEPPRLTTLAYDATALAAVLSRRGEHFDRAALTNPNGFAGVDGIFRLTDQGLVERGLAIDELVSGGPRVVSPAPITFAAYKTF